jgi:DNA repair exonuclease SbcCD ATPase subunit
MESQLSLSIVEIIVLMLGAITLGITIHFFIVSRRTLKASSPIINMKLSKERDDWKRRYLNDVEDRDKLITELRKKLSETEENDHISTIEAEELRSKNKKLQAEITLLKEAGILPNKTGYMDQLKEKVNDLLQQIDMVRSAEERSVQMQKDNEELINQVNELRSQLSIKEKAMLVSKQKQELTSEMSSMIDNAYNEFNVLQEKMMKLEGQVNASKMINLDYQDLKEENLKLLRDLEEHKRKYHAASAESKELEEALLEAEDKLKEANFQRQQLQKRVSYLEELNEDMQEVADANKKLETQIKRIGELESKLNIIAEERDELARRQMNA